jgi:uncharacterized protein (DUF2147 family)
MAAVSGLAAGLTLAQAAPAQAQMSPSQAQAAPAAPAGPAGRWATENNRSHIEIAPCGQNFCGKIVWMAEPLDEAGQPKLDKNNPAEELRSRPLLGLQLLSDFTADGEPGHWIGGKIYNPRDGEIYSASLALTDTQSLSVHGYVLMPLFGITKIWKKVDPGGVIAGENSGETPESE